MPSTRIAWEDAGTHIGRRTASWEPPGDASLVINLELGVT